ncbi:phospholipase D alpha 1-like [Primulina tabacum]|uniref:phospholipase D alpha 1-like n=1 Tax=Primulina tabacum TaxID=48773 RepID=UPI003F5A8132
MGQEITGSKLYATIDLGKARVGRTRLLHHRHSHPEWNESFHIYCAHTASEVVFTIKLDDAIGADDIATASVPVSDLIRGEVIDKWLEIHYTHHKLMHEHSKIHVKLQFYDVTRERCWARGIKSPKFPGVPFTFFPQRKECKVTLYQDAHVPDAFIPKIPLAGGKFYEPNRCWEDIFDAVVLQQKKEYRSLW